MNCEHSPHTRLASTSDGAPLARFCERKACREDVLAAVYSQTGEPPVVTVLAVPLDERLYVAGGLFADLQRTA